MVGEGSPLGNLNILRRMALPVEDDQRLVISPVVDRRQIGTTTVDLRLGTEWEAMRTYRFDAVDPGAESAATNELLQASAEEFRLTAGQRRGLVLHPGELLLALTLEYLSLPKTSGGCSKAAAPGRDRVCRSTHPQEWWIAVLAGISPSSFRT